MLKESGNRKYRIKNLIRVYPCASVDENLYAAAEFALFTTRS